MSFSTGGRWKRTIIPSPIAVNAQRRVVLLDLTTLHLRQRLNRRKSTVFRQGQWHRVQRGCKGAHGILLDRRDLVRSFLYSQRRADVRSTPAIYYAIVLDEVTNSTNRIVQGTLRFVDNLTCDSFYINGGGLASTRIAHHFVAPANKNRHGAGVGTLLDYHHLIPRGSKSDFADDSRLPKLLWS